MICRPTVYNRIERDHRLLKDHSDFGTPKVGEVPFAHREDVAPPDLDVARENRPAGRKETHQGPEGGALAGARLSEDAKDLSGIEGERHRAHRLYRGVAALESGRHVLGPDDGVPGGSSGGKCGAHRQVTPEPRRDPNPPTRMWQAAK